MNNERILRILYFSEHIHGSERDTRFISKDRTVEADSISRIRILPVDL